MKEYKYNKKSMAIKKQRQMQRNYGYKPAIFRVSRYVVIQPKGLRRI